jgi:hypothetical protein
MSVGYDQMIWEVVDLADVAVRTASQLRMVKIGRPLTEPEMLDRAVVFLALAREGGAFLTGKSASVQHTLRPLNWATDAYLALNQPAKANYDQVGDYLDRIIAALNAAKSNSATAAKSEVDLTANFFDKLGDILGAKADKMLRETPENPFGL